uniref:Uroporphyrinogen-III synthase n=1 Tax=Heterosigma akashiwo TaxID=2829 RepID=A0A6V1PSP3_HETAK|mmetsp:Transcript_11892/g.16503  ORF Transcript_11892/g.16503 Transcript_11892/m.16503 type:complete len:288 (-) Transcript_11892:360-1223(-)
MATKAVARIISLAVFFFGSIVHGFLTSSHSTAAQRTFSFQLDAKVALTREAGKNGKLKKLLIDEGFEVVELPCIRHARGEDLDKLAPALSSDEPYDYVIITSPEAADVFLKEWKKAGKPQVSVASVGAATSETLMEGGITPAFEPSKATAAVLSEELPLNGLSRVLYPASEKAKETLESGLAARGFSVTRLNTYTTLPTKWNEMDYVAAASADVVALASPTAADAWAGLVGRPRKPAACIGLTTAEECKKRGFGLIYCPEKPGMDGLVGAVKLAVDDLGGLKQHQKL